MALYPELYFLAVLIISIGVLLFFRRKIYAQSPVKSAISQFVFFVIINTALSVLPAFVYGLIAIFSAGSFGFVGGIAIVSTVGYYIGTYLPFVAITGLFAILVLNIKALLNQAGAKSSYNLPVSFSAFVLWLVIITTVIYIPLGWIAPAATVAAEQFQNPVICKVFDRSEYLATNYKNTCLFVTGASESPIFSETVVGARTSYQLLREQVLYNSMIDPPADCTEYTATCMHLQTIQNAVRENDHTQCESLKRYRNNSYSKSDSGYAECIGQFLESPEQSNLCNELKNNPNDDSALLAGSARCYFLEPDSLYVGRPGKPFDSKQAYGMPSWFPHISEISGETLRKEFSLAHVNPNQKDEEGNTALLYLLQHHFVPSSASLIVSTRELITAGVDPSIPNNEGITAKAYIEDTLIPRVPEGKDYTVVEKAYLKELLKIVSQ